MENSRPAPLTCDYLGCSFKVRPGETLCDEHKAEAYEHVNHPKHYNDHPSGIECIDVIEHMPFNIGTAMKYLWRAGLKPGQDSDQDLKKALWYIERQRTIGERTKR